MKITSPAFAHNQFIPVKYTCDGEDVSPPLAFADVPPAAKSLALIVDDPDAPVGLWTHWTAWNISPRTLEVVEGSVPAGAQEGTTSARTTGYHGPCPPSGVHRYFFKLFALDATLSLAAEAKLDELTAAMRGHVLAQSELVGLYSRN